MISPVKKHQHTKKILIAACLVVVILSLAAAYFVYRNHSATSTTKTPASQKPVNYGPATSDEKSAGDRIKEQALNNQKQNDSNDASSVVPLVITSVNQSSGTVYIRVMIEQITSAGTCTLSMSNGSGNTYTATSSVQSMASSSTCEGFNIPTSKLTTGDWSIKITYTNDSSSGSATGSVTVQ
jgi:hypothetical protein